MAHNKGYSNEQQNHANGSNIDSRAFDAVFQPSSVDAGECSTGVARCSLQGHLLILSRTQNLPGGANLPDRGEITEFSPSSAQRMRRYLRSSIANYSVLLTLTYAEDVSGDVSKDHLRRFIQELQRYDKRHKREEKTDSFFWFMEFQRSGRIHFHLFLTKKYEKQMVAELWYRIVGSEDKRHLAAGTRIESLRGGRHAVSAYASKYASKNEQKRPPESMSWVGRFWGVFGCRLTKEATFAVKQETASYSAVKAKIKAIKERVKRGLEEGKIRKGVSKRENIAVFYITCNKTIAELNILINQCQMILATKGSNPESDYYIYRIYETELEGGL